MDFGGLAFPELYRPLGVHLCSFHASGLSHAEQKLRFDELMRIRGERVEQFLTVAVANGHHLETDGRDLEEFGDFLASAFGSDYWELSDLDILSLSFVVDASLYLGSVIHAEIPSTRWVLAPRGRVGEGEPALVGFPARRHDPYAPLWHVNSFLMRSARGGEKQSVQLPGTVVQVTVPPVGTDEFKVQFNRLRSPS